MHTQAQGLFTPRTRIALFRLGMGCKAPGRSKVGTLQGLATPQTAQGWQPKGLRDREGEVSRP